MTRRIAVETCDMTMENMNIGSTGLSGYYPCGRIAKYKSPEKIFGRIYNLCGIHRRQIDNKYKKQGSSLRCIECLAAETREEVKP
jgi:hypothetical protein